MTEAEIAELFIQAAETERKLPATGTRPAKLKSQSLPFVHTFADMNGWGYARLREARSEIWEGIDNKLAPKDVSNWELCLRLIALIDNDRHRRCLSAWAASKVSGASFSAWCRDQEHITRQYGKECVTRAIRKISAELARNPLQHNDFAQNSTLQHDGKIGDLCDIIGDERDQRQPTFGMADDAKPLTFDEGLQDFSWAETQNARRRERDARKKKAA